MGKTDTEVTKWEMYAGFIVNSPVTGVFFVMNHDNEITFLSTKLAKRTDICSCLCTI